MNQLISNLAEKLTENNLNPSINLERPLFVQPEDRILYRSARIMVILGMLDTKYGISKEVIACVDFLLRNPGYQKKFIVEYFKEEKNLIEKLNHYQPSQTIEADFNIVQYKSVPWDLRFNDMFLYLYVRNLVKFIGRRPDLRVILTDAGKLSFDSLIELFIDEQNFLELFGKRINEDKIKKIITDVIPNTYWKENEKLDY